MSKKMQWDQVSSSSEAEEVLDLVAQLERDWDNGEIEKVRDFLEKGGGFFITSGQLEQAIDKNQIELVKLGLDFCPKSERVMISSLAGFRCSKKICLEKNQPMFELLVQAIKSEGLSLSTWYGKAIEADWYFAVDYIHQLIAKDDRLACRINGVETAAENANIEMLKKLVGYWKIENKLLTSVLIHGCYNGYVGVLNWCMSHFSPRSSKLIQSNKQLFMEHALRGCVDNHKNKKLEVIDWLMEQGVKITDFDAKQKRDFLHYALMGSVEQYGDGGLIKRLYNEGCRLLAADVPTEANELKQMENLFASRIGVMLSKEFRSRAHEDVAISIVSVLEKEGLLIKILGKMGGGMDAYDQVRAKQLKNVLLALNGQSELKSISQLELDNFKTDEMVKLPKWAKDTVKAVWEKIQEEKQLLNQVYESTSGDKVCDVQGEGLGASEKMKKWRL